MFDVFLKICSYICCCHCGWLNEQMFSFRLFQRRHNSLKSNISSIKLASANAEYKKLKELKKCDVQLLMKWLETQRHLPNISGMYSPQFYILLCPLISGLRVTRTNNDQVMYTLQLRRLRRSRQLNKSATTT